MQRVVEWSKRFCWKLVAQLTSSLAAMSSREGLWDAHTGGGRQSDRSSYIRVASGGFNCAADSINAVISSLVLICGVHRLAGCVRPAAGRTERSKSSPMKVTGMCHAFARAYQCARQSPAARIREFQTRSSSRSPTLIGRKRKRLSGKYRSKGSLFHLVNWTAKVVTGSVWERWKCRRSLPFVVALPSSAPWIDESKTAIHMRCGRSVSL